jgi:hypothetical protein
MKLVHWVKGCILRFYMWMRLEAVNVNKVI